MPELLFHGATGEVTGSMHLVRVDERWVALDCGLYQGRRAEAEEKNRQWPVPPSQIAAVVLSHAHTDHSGRLPRLVKDGFEGPIYCTPATRDLCSIMLPDTAHIQEEDVVYVNKKRQRKQLPPIQALYEYPDAFATLGLIYSVPYNRWFQVVPGMLACLVEAGHMLGSAGVRLEFAKRNGETPSLYFSGDLGRVDQPIIRDPAPFPATDVVICESTYGGRVNEQVPDARQELAKVVRRTYERGGKVVIPAFSVGRTQSVAYYLQELIQAGELPPYPVFVDSPLAVDATEIFRMHPECYDADARQFQKQKGDLLGPNCCTYIRDVEQSKKLHKRRKRCTIISASGMCEAGRIRHHIKNNIKDPKNTVLFAGFQAEHTLGRRLVDGAETINLFQEVYRVRAEVVQIHGFSAHADQDDLLRTLLPLKDQTRKLYIVHGEPDQSEALVGKLQESGFGQVEIPRRGERVML